MDVMSTYCQTFEISMEKYIEECKAAFKTNDEKSLYSFSVEEDRLNVRKLSDGAQSGSNVRVILTSVLLKTVISMYEGVFIREIMYFLNSTTFILIHLNFLDRLFFGCY